MADAGGGVRALCGDAVMTHLCDLLVWPAGPRLRDRLAHGETAPAALPSPPAHHLLWLTAQVLVTARPGRWAALGSTSGRGIDEQPPSGSSVDRCGVGSEVCSDGVDCGADEGDYEEKTLGSEPAAYGVDSGVDQRTIESSGGSPATTACSRNTELGKDRTRESGKAQWEEFGALCYAMATGWYHPSFHQFSVLQRAVVELCDIANTAAAEICSLDHVNTEADPRGVHSDTIIHHTEVARSPSDFLGDTSVDLSVLISDPVSSEEDPCSDVASLSSLVSASRAAPLAAARAAVMQLRPALLQLTRRQTELLTRLQLLVNPLASLWRQAAAAEQQWRRLYRQRRLRTRARATWRRMRASLADFWRLTADMLQYLLDGLTRLRAVETVTDEVWDRGTRLVNKLCACLLGHVERWPAGMRWLSG